MNIPNDFTIGSVNQLTPERTKQNSELNQEDFLKIMSAAISNPSMSGDSSESHTDYLSQMAQFSMLDQLSEVTNALQTTMLMTQQQQALSLVGKEVTVAGSDSGFVTGNVEKVRFSNGYATIQVNGTEYALNSVLEVGESMQ